MKQGFTLLELSIVLVIIGLIIGGITVGADLIRAAEINSVISDNNKFKVAINTFRLKYNGVPGLIENAYDYFQADCGTNDASHTRGCNGDGRDCHTLIVSGTACNNTQRRLITGNSRRIFVHLNLSGIMPNVPYLADAALETDCSIGTISPQLPIGEGTFSTLSNTPGKIYNYYFSPSSDIAHTGAFCGFSTMSGIVDPQEMFQIDDKIDDGNGRDGKVQAIIDYTTDIFSNTDCMDANGVYNLSNDNKDCGFRIEIE